MKLYAYCLADKLAPAPSPGLLGIGGGKVYLLPLETVSAVVSEFQGENLALSRENVSLHEQVIEDILSAASPLPFRFGTVVTEEELKEYCDRHEARIGEALDRVRGCVEMNVKIIAPAKEWRPGRGMIRGKDACDALEAGPGTRFLIEKAGALKSEAAVLQQAEQIAASVAGRLAGIILDTRMSYRLGGEIFLGLAHLVERKQLRRYQELIRDLRQEQKNLHFLTSGPWPPYSFTPVPESGKAPA